MKNNDLFRIKVFFKDGTNENFIGTLNDFENWYGNNLKDFYHCNLELVKECN